MNKKTKDVATRVAIDVMKYNTAHAGSPLMSPLIGNGTGGMNLWTSWAPRIAITPNPGGGILDPSSYSIQRAYHTKWGNIGFFEIYFVVFSYEGLTGTLCFDCPPNWASQPNFGVANGHIYNDFKVVTGTLQGTGCSVYMYDGASIQSAYPAAYFDCIMTATHTLVDL